MPVTVCRIERACRRYAPHPAPAVLDQLDLELGAAEIVAVLGASGSGKSTLLNLVGQMDQPDAGSVLYVDATDRSAALRNAGGWDDDTRTAFRRRRLGFVFQAYNLLPTLTLRENIALPLELNGAPDDDRTDSLIADLDLADAADRYPDAASGGEQQRAAIARALVHRPLLVIADEPTGNLDPVTAERVITLFERCVRDAGASVLLATHSDRVAACADRRLYLRHGRLESAAP